MIILQACTHERGHISDSRFFGHRYATEVSRRIFCDRCRFERWLAVEAALAGAQAELGVIPAWAGQAITAAARVELLDLDAVRAEIRRTGHSLVGLLRVFEAACPDGAGEYIHYGATTQDIQDTAQALEMREVTDELLAGLRAVADPLAALASRHQADVALGRTHAQPALPVSFGLKVASWLDELSRHAERVTALRGRVLVAQLFGGVGSMAGLGERALPTLERFAARLGLGVPAIGWHVARDRVTEYVTTLAMVTGTLARIADEVRTLSRPEFGEVTERWTHGKVGSSTMPHKRNPEGCEQVVALSRLAAGAVGPALAAMGGDHERDSRTLRIEWACVPDVSHYCLAACEITRDIVSGLTVNPERLRANVEVVADQLATEGLMLALAGTMGKQTAHHHVYELSQHARSNGLSVRSVAAADAAVRAHLSDADLERIFDPARYLGESATLTRRVLSAVRPWLFPDAATGGAATGGAATGGAATGGAATEGAVLDGAVLDGAALDGAARCA
jgi:adenylosuccinate lyase